jgi:hypothetical protein
VLWLFSFHELILVFLQLALIEYFALRLSKQICRTVLADQRIVDLLCRAGSSSSG